MSITSKIDNIVRIPEEALCLKPPIPPAVKVDVTRDCNHRCTFCSHSKGVTTGSMANFDFMRWAMEMKKAGVKEIAPFYWGEPFMNRNALFSAIETAKAIGFEYIFLTTNGVLAKAESVDRCMALGLNSLKFSLNYASPEQYAEVTQCPPSNFKKILDNIQAARAVRDAGKYNCKLYASYIEYDAEQGERMKDVLDHVGGYLDEVYALPLYNQAAKVKNDDWSFSGGNQGRKGGEVPPVPCWALFREGHLNFDGTLCACCFSVSDAFNMGNLHEESFREAWHSEKFQALRRAHLKAAAGDWSEFDASPCAGCVKRTKK